MERERERERERGARIIGRSNILSTTLGHLMSENNWRLMSVNQTGSSGEKAREGETERQREAS